MNKRIFLSPPYMFGNERKLVDEAFDSNYIAPCGPMVECFEKTFAEQIGVPHTCALSSCSAALDLLFYDLRVVAGDIVFCSNLTFVASIAPAVQRGATPVFIGSDVSTWTMSPVLLEEALHDAALRGKLPKVVIAVDLYGQCCDYGAIEQICEEFEVPLIVDAAEALGARYWGTGVAGQGAADEFFVRGADRLAPQKPKSALPCPAAPAGCVRWRHAGDAGWAGVFSFNGNKIITSSGGGMLVSQNEELVRRACKRSQQSRDAKVWYEHSELGYNYRMSNIVAAIGLGQLLNLDQIIARKRSVFKLYEQFLSDCHSVRWMPEADYGRCNRWLTVAMLGKEVVSDSMIAASGEPSVTVMELIKSLESENIEARPIWKPMHLQPVFKDCLVYGGEVDESIFSCGICLPSGTGMSEDDTQRVSEIVRSVLV